MLSALAREREVAQKGSHSQALSSLRIGFDGVCLTRSKGLELGGGSPRGRAGAWARGGAGARPSGRARGRAGAQGRGPSVRQRPARVARLARISETPGTRETPEAPETPEEGAKRRAYGARRGTRDTRDTRDPFVIRAEGAIAGNLRPGCNCLSVHPQGVCEVSRTRLFTGHAVAPAVRSLWHRFI